MFNIDIECSFFDFQFHQQVLLWCYSTYTIQYRSWPQIIRLDFNRISMHNYVSISLSGYKLFTIGITEILGNSMPQRSDVFFSWNIFSNLLMLYIIWFSYNLSDNLIGFENTSHPLLSIPEIFLTSHHLWNIGLTPILNFGQRSVILFINF